MTRPNLLHDLGSCQCEHCDAERREVLAEIYAADVPPWLSLESSPAYEIYAAAQDAAMVARRLIAARVAPAVRGR